MSSGESVYLFCGDGKILFSQTSHNQSRSDKRLVCSSFDFSGVLVILNLL